MLAWNEGLATFLALVAANESPQKISVPNYDTRVGEYIDINNNGIDVNAEIGYGVQSYKNEAAVTSVLWDLYDFSVDIGDNISSLPLRGMLFSILDSDLDFGFQDPKDLPPIGATLNLVNFYNAWVSRVGNTIELDNIIIHHAPNLLHEFDWIFGTKNGDPHLGTGSPSDEIFFASFGVDAIEGGGGNDTLIVDLDLSMSKGEGVAYWINGNFFDAGMINIANDALRDALNAPATSYQIRLGSLGTTTATEVEHFKVGLTATNSDDLLIYQSGIWYQGGAGNDTFFANWGADTAGVKWSNDPSLTQDISLNGVIVTIGGVERLLLTTGTGNDVISNSKATTDDFFVAGGGSDIVSGGDGSDYIVAPAKPP